MTYLLALLIFLAITTATWFIAVAVYNTLFNGLNLLHNTNFTTASTSSILLVTLNSLMPFPAGYVFSLVVWGLAAWGMLELSWFRGGVLFILLAALSFLSRLAILGVLSY